jgi:hypothetical protein
MAKRREGSLQAVGHGLIQPYRAIEILQTLLAEILEDDGEILFVLEQCLRRLRDQNLVAVTGGSDPCCAVNG